MRLTAIIIINLLSTTLSCTPSETKEKSNNIKEKMSTNINSEIASFSDRPYYQTAVKSSGVAFDIRINDVPVARFKGPSGGTQMEYPINMAITSSGKQELTVIVSPLPGKDKLTPKDAFSIAVNMKKDAWVFDNQREVVLEIPKMEIPESGLPKWEFKGIFEAKVPFNFKGWKASQDLTKVADLQSLVEAKYKEIQEAIETKNNSNFKALTGKKVIEEAIALYEKEDGQDQGFQPEKEKAISLNGSKLHFYGYGKLVRLEMSDGETALRTELTIGDKKEIYNYPILLHMPTGSKELEVIR